ncbi:MAG: hypothetical protein ACJ76H_10475 [Bacteriovoracaceae bacterium]
MVWIFFLLTTFGFANTFNLGNCPEKFSLVIDSRHLIYHSDKKNVNSQIKKCNLPLVRALNGELMALVPQKNFPDGLAFMVDGNKYFISGQGKEAKVLFAMNARIERFQEEEKKACP